MEQKNNFNILHVSEIDNDLSKGTSNIIPQYIMSQSKVINNIGLLNCNDIELKELAETNNIYKLYDNTDMKVIKEFKPSLLVFHEVYKPYYLKLYKYCLNNKIPYIIIPHGCLTKKAQKHKKIKKIAGNLLFFYDFINHAEYIQYLSQNESNETNFNKHNCYVLGNGIENIPNNNMYKKIRRTDKNGLNLIYVGRYDYLIKGLDQLIIACKLIKEEMIDKKIKILLYGTGDNSKILKNIKKNELEQVIILNGAIFGEEKRKEIVQSDVFIQVSRTEAQPLGIMEAMTLGMPVLVSEGTGFSNIVETNECRNSYKM